MKERINNRKSPIYCPLVILLITALFCSFFCLNPVKAAETQNDDKWTYVTTDEQLAQVSTFHISTVKDLNAFRAALNKAKDYNTYKGFEDKTIVLDNDITLKEGDLIQGDTYNGSITQNPFKGTFNGLGHTINNYNDTIGGFFNGIDQLGCVYNLNLTVNNTYEDNSDYTQPVFGKSNSGPLAFSNSGTICNCSVVGSMTINRNGYNNAIYVGGLIGSNSGSLNNCYTNVTITTNGTLKSGKGSYIGGLDYKNGSNAKMKNCYVRGIINDNTTAVSGTIRHNIYAIGLDSGTRSNCYYLDEIQTQAGSKFAKTKNSGNALAETAMKEKASYTGFNFDTEPKEWAIDSGENNGYPYLLYVVPDSDPNQIYVTADIQIADKTVPEDTSNLTSDFLNAEYSITPKASTSANQKILNDCNAHFELREGEAATPVKFRGIATTAEDFSGKGTTLLNNYQLVYDATKVPDGKTIYCQLNDTTTQQNPVYKKDYTVNSPSLTFNAKTHQPISEVQQTSEKAQLKVAQTNSLDQWYKDKKAEDLISTEIKTNTAGQYADADSWSVFTMTRAGYLPSAYQSANDFNKACYDLYAKRYQAMKKTDESGDYIDLDLTMVCKDALAITAMGYDARDVGGVNLINAIQNSKNKSSGGIISPVCAYAIDSYKYITDGNKDYILGLAQNLLDSKGNMATDQLIDMSLMQWQPIFAYYDPNAKPGDEYYLVKQAVEEAGLPYIQNHQAYNGSFYNGFNVSNPWSDAQIHICMGLGKINIYDTNYIQNGFSMISKTADSWQSFGSDESQIARGYEALLRSFNNQKSLFDCTDVSQSTVPVNDFIQEKNLPQAETLTDISKVDTELMGNLKAIDEKIADLKLSEDQIQALNSNYLAVKAKVASYVKIGDVNGDGKINAEDATMVLKADAQMITLSDGEKLAADVNNDGAVNSEDATLILKYDAQLITSF